jgi:hypothetical protein
VEFENWKETMVVRLPNTTTAGRSFDQFTINAVWQKAQVIQG